MKAECAGPRGPALSGVRKERTQRGDDGEDVRGEEEKGDEEEREGKRGKKRNEWMTTGDHPQRKYLGKVTAIPEVMTLQRKLPGVPSQFASLRLSDSSQTEGQDWVLRD